MKMAITRDVSSSIDRCEITHLDREPIDHQRASTQHREYARLLEIAGCRVVAIPEDGAFPDAVFIEDTAVVLDELAIITRPGAESRRGETAAVATALAPYRALRTVDAPATLDGGDVLLIDHRIFIGESERTTSAAIEQVRRIAAPLGYDVTGVAVSGCLHLKTAVTEVGEGTLLINRAWVDASRFEPFVLIEVDPSEPFAGNALRIDFLVVYPSSYPKTAERLREAGIKLATVDASELAKAEGGVTCCSLVFEV
ncbi:MAG TPA: arginine deiminase-related protein [Thermoanaerobaculia bacterium]|nr:arginine deiminase-related protein [Thermoanaerobaculia bacterium]